MFHIVSIYPSRNGDREFSEEPIEEPMDDAASIVLFSVFNSFESLPTSSSLAFSSSSLLSSVPFLSSFPIEVGANAAFLIVTIGSGSTFSIYSFCVVFVAFLLLNAAPIPPSTAPTPPVIIAAALLTAAEFNTIFLNSFPPAKDFAALTALSIWIFGEVYSALARLLTCFSSNAAASSAIIPEPSLDGKIEKSMITLPDLILLISNRSLCMPRE